MPPPGNVKVQLTDATARWQGGAARGAATATIPGGSGGVPVGLPVFKTGGAAPGVARWVRLPCAPANEGPMADGDDEQPDWSAYYRGTTGREVRPLFARGLAAARASGVTGGRAVEIGFGDGTETRALLGAGFSVLAVEATEAAEDFLRPGLPRGDADRLEVVIAPAQEVALGSFDLLYSGYVLSFVPPAAFPVLWARVRAGLRPGGILAVNVFGVRDSWAGEPGMTFLDREAVDRLVDGLEVLDLREEDADGDSFGGPKHWHVFDVIARRPGGAPA
jgi:SAM-dependent methyltransferase